MQGIHKLTDVQKNVTEEAEVTLSTVLHLPNALIFTFLRKKGLIYSWRHAGETYFNAEYLSGMLGVTGSTHFSCGNDVVFELLSLEAAPLLPGRWTMMTPIGVYETLSIADDI